MFTKLKIWLQYIVVRRALKAAKMEGYGKLETGALYPAVSQKLIKDGFEQYTQGGYLSAKRYFWTTSPVTIL